jgi:hypothetical protein
MQGMPIRKLTPITNLEGRAIWVPDRADVVVRGQGTLMFECPHCGQLLGENLFDRQVFEVVIECGACRKYSVFPSLGPGETVPLRPGLHSHMWVPRGKARFSEAADIRAASVIGDGGIMRKGKKGWTTMSLPRAPRIKS